MNNTNSTKREERKNEIKANFEKFGLVKSHNEVEGDLLDFQDELKRKLANPIQNKSVNIQALKSAFYDLQNRYYILQDVFKKEYLLYQDLQKIKSAEAAKDEMVHLFNLLTQKYNQNKNKNKIKATNFYTTIPSPPKKERRFSFPGLTNIKSKVKETFRRASFGGKRKQKTRRNKA